MCVVKSYQWFAVLRTEYERVTQAVRTRRRRVRATSHEFDDVAFSRFETRAIQRQQQLELSVFLHLCYLIIIGYISARRKCFANYLMFNIYQL